MGGRKGRGGWEGGRAGERKDGRNGEGERERKRVGSLRDKEEWMKEE